MISPLTDCELLVLSTIIDADEFGHTPGIHELARLSGRPPSECGVAIGTLQDKGRLLRLPDGGLAPQNA